MEENFEIANNAELFGLPYDFKSVMHYHGQAFSSNGLLTVQTLNRQYQKSIGQDTPSVMVQ